jgi:radical SAM superfamily enzyme YgiQ (UPF0313 family)
MAVVVGEAELVMPQVLDDLAQGALRGIYKAKTLHSMVDMPMPRYDLVKQDRYVNRTSIQTLCGCHHGCTFCSEPLMNGLKFRYRPVDEVIREVESCGQRYISQLRKGVHRCRLRHVRLFGADALSRHPDVVPDGQGQEHRVVRLGPV